MKERKSWLMRWTDPHTSHNSELPSDTQGRTQSPQYKRGRVASDCRSEKSVLTGQDKAKNKKNTGKDQVSLLAIWWYSLNVVLCFCQ